MNSKILNDKLIVTVNQKVQARKERVWEILTLPKYIKQYLYGTDAISEWKEGSSLVFKGEWEGKQYEDYGSILAFQPYSVFKYSYFSSFFGLPDEPENYSLIETILTSENDHTMIHLTQSGFTSEESRNHSEISWKRCLEIIKEIAENQTDS